MTLDERKKRYDFSYFIQNISVIAGYCALFWMRDGKLIAFFIHSLVMLRSLPVNNIMKNTNINTNICYVFSQQTLDIAIDEWVDNKTEGQPNEKEAFQITKAALPWFMKHLNQSGSIYMFSADDMKSEIDVWKHAQFKAFPKRKKRIEETCDLLVNFFNSDIIERHKMTVHA